MSTNGYTIYSGPSQIDGSPIIVLVTGYSIPTANQKMGRAPLQTWILRSDMAPPEANRIGADVAICGDCPHRGWIESGRNIGRSCYVFVEFGVRNVWLAWHRGNYPRRERFADIVRCGHARMVRLGSYGDPAAAPLWVWEGLTHGAAWHMGYTRRWRDCDPGFKALCMASVHSAAEREEAKALGWRTFRTRTADQSLGEREIACPASAEMGKRSTCEECRACSGLGSRVRADVAIIAHGPAGRVGNFKRRAR